MERQKFINFEEFIADDITGEQKIVLREKTPWKGEKNKADRVNFFLEFVFENVPTICGGKKQQRNLTKATINALECLHSSPSLHIQQ